MSLSINLNQKLNIIEVSLSGVLTYDLFKQMTVMTIEQVQKSGMKRILIDGSDAISTNMNVEIIEKIASDSSILNHYFASGKCAIVIQSDVDFGLSRIWLAMAEENIEYQSAVFKTEEEAKLWLMDVNLAK
jgi:hypothetical protein